MPISAKVRQDLKEDVLVLGEQVGRSQSSLVDEALELLLNKYPVLELERRRFRERLRRQRETMEKKGVGTGVRSFQTRMRSPSTHTRTPQYNLAV